MKNLASLTKLLGFISVATLSFADSPEKKTPNSYNPIGKRDPFKVLSAAATGRKLSSIYPTEKYNLEQLNLKAILQISGKSRAMIQAPDGKTFIVYEGEVVGRERATLSRILKTEIIFSQKTFNYLGNASLVEHVLSLPSEASASGLEELFEKTGEAPASAVEKKRGAGGLNGLKDNIKKIMNRPQQLEKDLDEVIVPSKN